ncbi:MAG: tetratricopeptide repeat protein [Bryobacteraceae bacterium]
MKPEQWERVQEIVDAALDLPAAERKAFLAKSCRGDEALLRDSEKLIASHDQAGGFLDHPIGLAASSHHNLRALPSRIGRYRIVRLLGEGGMGSVYEAEQDNPRRTVALKVIRPGLVTLELLRRFERETQALGRLHHPGIAQIHEAGTAESTAGAQPYFAMEFVAGPPLTDYAESNRLSSRDRLALAIKVCEAVEHAHRHGIVHRDLKPGNILVDADGQPKVLDFGVARVTDAGAQITRRTDMGQLVGTLAYMSPEQVLGDPGEIDGRTDVYALGVIFYELLAGRLPYETSGKLLHEAVRAVREQDPAPLSSINRTYRGDVETIAGKALEKDKARRYGSAAEMARDIQRYLDNRPIMARPPGAGYQAGKFARRNRALVVGAGAVFLTLAGGVVVSTWEAVRARSAEIAALQQRDKAAAAEKVSLAAGQAARRERDRAMAAEAQSQRERDAALAEKQRADSEQAAATAVNEFLRNDVLAQASARMQTGGPETPAEPDLKVRTALDRAAARIEGRFHGQPAVEASIRQTIGDTYLDWGLGHEAELQIRRVIELRRRALGERHPDTLTAIERLGMIYNRAHGDYAEAERLLERVVNERRSLQGEHHLDTLRSIGNLAVIYINRGKYTKAERLIAPVMDACRRVFGERHPETLQNLATLAIAYKEQGKLVRAEGIQSRVLELYRLTKGERHPLAVLALNNLADTYDKEGKYGQAEPLFIRAVELSRSISGEEHPSTLLYENNLADLERKTDRYAEAELGYRHVLEIRRRVLGEEHPDTLISMMGVGRAARGQGAFDNAAQVFSQVLEIRRRTLGEEHPYTFNSMFELARTYDRQGKFADAGNLYARLMAGRRRVLGPRHPATLIAQLGLGRALLEQRKYEDAEIILRECLSGYQKTAPDAWQRFDAESALGASLAGERKFQEAEALMVESYPGLLEPRPGIPTEDRSALVQARSRLVDLYENWGKPEQATRWR